jgi:hypothetical protein
MVVNNFTTHSKVCEREWKTKELLRTSLEIFITAIQQRTFINKDYIKGDIKWCANNMEALAEFQMPTVATAQHICWYRLRLAQQWRWWILESQSVHLRQPHGELPVVCEHIITNYAVIQARGCLAVMRVEQSILFIAYYRQDTIFFSGFTNKCTFSCKKVSCVTDSSQVNKTRPRR